MLRRILLASLALAALVLGTGALVRACAADETKIRWLIADMEEAYNEGDAGDSVGPLARDWRHEGYSIDRQLLLGALFQASRERDRETKQLLSRVEVDEDAAAITVEGDRATLECEALFSRLRRGTWEEAWRVRFTAELVEGDGGWEIVRSRHEDLRGTHLGR
jgi:hypothetical protein